MLKFSYGNRKMHELAKMLNLKKNEVTTFDLPAGYTCPMANLCSTYSNRITGKITDGKKQVFRCYAASGEARFTRTRELHWHNFDLLKGKSLDAMVEVINSSIPNKTKVIRIHSSGDFFSLDYFLAWVKVAQLNPEINFFGYTKVLPYVSATKPNNFKLVYSYGGKLDNMLTNEAVAFVVKNEGEAISKGVKIACKDNPSDDFNFIMQGLSFAIEIHGTQPAKRLGAI